MKVPLCALLKFYFTVPFNNSCSIDPDDLSVTLYICIPYVFGSIMVWVIRYPDHSSQFSPVSLQLFTNLSAEILTSSLFNNTLHLIH